MSETITKVMEALGNVVENKDLLQKVNPDTHLFEAAIIDSVETIAFMTELENVFGVTVDENDLFSPDFTTVRGIAGIIEGKL